MYKGRSVGKIWSSVMICIVMILVLAEFNPCAEVTRRQDFLVCWI